MFTVVANSNLFEVYLQAFSNLQITNWKSLILRGFRMYACTSFRFTIINVCDLSNEILIELAYK